MRCRFKFPVSQVEVGTAILYRDACDFRKLTFEIRNPQPAGWRILGLFK